MKTRRAAQEESTRLRITEALVDLHGTIGPARTTIREVATRAGVQRATVYRHFPDEATMLEACTAHWIERNPLPDRTAWAAIADPREQLRVALAEVYAFFERNERMLENSFRDEARVAALRRPMDSFREWFRAAAAELAARGVGRRLPRAALGLALSFSTWKSLAREQGLDRHEAVEVIASMVA